MWLANNQTSVTITTRQLDMVTKTKNQKFPNSIQPSILVGFFLKTLSYNIHVSSNSSQVPFLAYLAHTSQQFSSLDTKSISKEGINQISKVTLNDFELLDTKHAQTSM